MTEADATFVVQFWKHHFLNDPWLHSLEDAACADLDGRELDVRDYLPDSFLETVKCKVRPLTDDEASANGRTFAKRAYHGIEFALFGFQSSTLEQRYEDGEHKDLLTVDEFFGYSVGAELERFCHILLFLVGVCHASPMHLETPSTFFRGGNVGSSPFSLISIDRDPAAYDFLEEDIRSPVCLDGVLRWSKGCSGIWTGSATTRIEKAVSLFSHTLSASSGAEEVSRFIWSVSALEALVCASSTGVLGQLKRRLPKLSQSVSFKNLPKLVSSAYQLRSRLLHGDLALSNAFTTDEEEVKRSNPEREIWKYGNALQVVLISCLWSAIRAAAYDCQFDEKMVLSGSDRKTYNS